MDRRRFCVASLATLGAAVLEPWARPAAAQGSFFFRDKDRVVMIGDSITEQLLHSNYVEAFVLSRNPAWDLRFRNVGIGGDTSTGGNRRAQRDLLSFKPTAVTITFGMNDGGYRQPYDPARLAAYTTGLQGILDQLKPAGVRVAVLSSSPVEKQENGPALEGYNQTLEKFAAGAKDVAEKNAARFVDQFHGHVAALQKARDAGAANRINGGDAVHPGASGQYLMAALILKGLGATPLVSAVEVPVAGRPTSRNCAVTGFTRPANGVRFLRADQALPWWIAPNGRSILPWAPVVEELDQYTLKVAGLSAGSHEVRVDGEKCAVHSADELSRGVNLALATEGPIARQSQALHDAVFAKNRYYHDQIFRGVVLNNGIPEDQKAAQIAARMGGMAPLEQAVRDALALRPHVWEVVKVG